MKGFKKGLEGIFAFHLTSSIEPLFVNIGTKGFYLNVLQWVTNLNRSKILGYSISEISTIF